MPYLRANSNAAIEGFVPAAQRAAVAGQLFGEEGSIAMSRIDTATLRQATEDVLAFGVVVSEQDADQIERTNDAISRLGLIWRGLSNQLAVAAAPALEAVANAMAAVASRTGPLGTAIQGLFTNLDTAFASVMSGAGILWQLYGMWTAKQPLTMDSSKAVTLKSVALPLFAVMVLAAAVQPAYAQLGGDYCITPGACQACPDTCPPPGECPPTAVELPLVEYEGSHFFLVPEDRRAMPRVAWSHSRSLTCVNMT